MGIFIRYHTRVAVFFSCSLRKKLFFWGGRGLNPFRAPKPLLILTSSSFVTQKRFPVLKALSSQIEEPQKKKSTSK